MYRTEPPQEREHASHINDTTTDTIITVMNGVVSRIDFPCYYAYCTDGTPIPHRRFPSVWKDHIGWPSPNRRDHSFQPTIIENMVIEPIHLTQEGYNLPMIAFDNPPTGLSWSVSIDDYIVKLELDVACSAANSNEVDVPFALYVTGSFDIGDGNTYSARDMVTKGKVKILPALHGNS